MDTHACALRGITVATAALAALPALLSARQDAPDPLRILERASERYESLQGFCADFDQSLTVPLLDQVTHSEGRLCQRQPDRFSMRFTDPAGDLVLADGEWLWIYFPSSDAKQVIRSPMASGQPGRFDFHREFLSDPGTKYEPTYVDSDLMDGALTHVIRLVPRQASAYREARVWIDDRGGIIRRVEIEEENGNLRKVALAALDPNPDFSADAFRFTPPSGVQIITR